MHTPRRLALAAWLSACFAIMLGGCTRPVDISISNTRNVPADCVLVLGCTPSLLGTKADMRAFHAIVPVGETWASVGQSSMQSELLLGPTLLLVSSEGTRADYFLIDTLPPFDLELAADRVTLKQPDGTPKPLTKVPPDSDQYTSLRGKALADPIVSMMFRKDAR